MKVKDLIKELQSMNPEHEAYVSDTKYGLVLPDVQKIVIEDVNADEPMILCGEFAKGKTFNAITM